MDELGPSGFYRWSHFLHLALAAVWIAAAMASHLKLRQIGHATTNDARHASWTAARRITILIEMPCAALILIAGLLMVGQDLALFRQSWFHVKLLFAILILLLFILASVPQRAIGELLDADGVDEAAPKWQAKLRAYQVMRFGAALATIGLIQAVTFQFGSP